LEFGKNNFTDDYMAIPNKSPFKIFEKMERGRIQGLSNFLGTPYYLGE